MNIAIRKAVVAFAVTALGLAGCATNKEAPTPTGPTTATAPANATATLVRIGSKKVTKKPRLKRGGDGEKYLINLLRYTQTLAIKGDVPVPEGGLSYHVLQPGQILECDEERSPSTVNGNRAYYSIMWCPAFKGFVLSPASAGQRQPEADALARGFYGSGIAQLTNATNPEKAASCYHGLILRQETKDDPIKWRAAPKRFEQYYDGSVSTKEGLLEGTCNQIS